MSYMSLLSPLICSLSYTSQCIAISLFSFPWENTTPVEEFASPSSIATLPMDLTLLHHCLCHHHLAGIRKLFSGNLVIGLRLDLKAELDPACEACKAEKIYADPFPFSPHKPLGPFSLSIAMCMALLSYPLIRAIATGCASLMTSLTSRQSIS
jgi:hypothetical protein